MGRTYQSTVVEAPIGKVWAKIRNFHDMSWAPNVITKLEVAGDLVGDQIGARRILNEAFHETLLELSDIEHTVRYSIDDGPSPVAKSEISNYTGCLTLKPISQKGWTFVEWSSNWDGDPDTVGEFCHGIYVAFLGDLEKSLAE